jgi:minor curlin subunit
MLKKLAVGFGCLGLLLGATTMSFAGGGGHGGGCPGDHCEVSGAMDVELGVNITLDVDVCIDAGNMNDDNWSTQASIAQYGDENTASITQTSTSQLAGILQVGDGNKAGIGQTGNKEYAAIGQYGDLNTAYINQTLADAAAIVIQWGNSNTAYINQ